MARNDQKTGSCDFKQYMLKKEGDTMEKGEVIAIGPLPMMRRAPS
jgi:hypothetical protein